MIKTLNLKSVLIFALVLLIPFTHKEAYSIFDPDLVYSKILLAVCAFGGFYVFVRNLKSYSKDIFFILLSLLVGFQILSLFASNSIPDSTKFILFQASVLFLYVLLKDFLKKSKSGVKNIVLMYALAITFMAGFMIRQIYLQENLGIASGGVWPVPGYPTRYGATFWDVNHFGAFVSAIFFLLMGFILKTLFLHGDAQLSEARAWILSKVMAIRGFRFFNSDSVEEKSNHLSKPQIIWLLVLSVFLLFALKLTGSRSAFLGFLVGGTLFTYLIFVGSRNLRKSISSAGFYLTSGLIAAGVPLLFISQFMESMRSAFLYRAVSFYSHLFLLKVGIIIGFENFLYGIGVNSFSEYFRTSKWADAYYYIDRAALNLKLPLHNLWLETWVETGLFSFLVFLLFWIILLVMLFQVYKSRSDYMALGLMAGIISFLVGGLFYSYKSEFFWFYVVFACAYASLRIKGELRIREFIVNNRKVLLLGVLGLVSILAPLVYFIFPLNAYEIGQFYLPESSNSVTDFYRYFLNVFRYVLGNYSFTGRALSVLFYFSGLLIAIGLFRRIGFGILSAYLYGVLALAIGNIYHPLGSTSPSSFYIFLMFIALHMLYSVIRKYRNIIICDCVNKGLLAIMIVAVSVLGVVRANDFYGQGYDSDLSFLIELAANRSMTNNAVIYIENPEWSPLIAYYTDRLEDDDFGKFYFVRDQIVIYDSRFHDTKIYDENTKLLVLTSIETNVTHPTEVTEDMRFDEITQGEYRLTIFERLD